MRLQLVWWGPIGGMWSHLAERAAAVIRWWHWHSWSRWSEKSIRKAMARRKDGNGIFQEIPIDSIYQCRKCEVCGAVEERHIWQ